MEKGKTCFVIFVGYETYKGKGTTAMYVCSTEKKAQDKLQVAVENAIQDLQEHLSEGGYKYEPSRLSRFECDDFCIKLVYNTSHRRFQYNIFYNELPMD